MTNKLQESTITDARAVWDKNGDFLGLLGTDGKVQSITSRAKGTAGRLTHQPLRLFAANAMVGTGAALVYDVPASGGYVSSVTAEIPLDADGLFVVLANANTGAQLVVTGVNYCCPTDMSQKPFNALAKTAGSFSGSAGVNIAAAPSANLATYVMSDVTQIATKPRTDDTSKKTRIVHARVAFSAANNATPLTYWSRGGTRWAQDNKGGELWTTISPGNLASNVYGLGNPADRDGGCLIFGIGYVSRGKVRVVGVNWDSFAEGSEEGSGARSFIVQSIINSASDDIPTEYMLMGKGGVTAANYTDRAMAIMALYKPTDIIQGAYTPNNGAATEAAIDEQRWQTLRMMRFADDNNISVYLTTPAPNTNAGNTVSTLNEAAAARQAAYAEEIRGFGRGLLDIEKLTGDGTGLWKTGATADGVHVAQAWADANIISALADELKIQA